MSNTTQREWAKLGATARLQIIDVERAVILKEFPELAKGVGTRPKRTFSRAARARMSAGMRKFWARRKADAKAKVA